MHELVAGYANYASTEALLREQLSGLEAGYYPTIFSVTAPNSVTLSWTSTL
ncbi:hypothetical protein GT755_21510 [Herbidospora sp. NEAU-GS84]|uniref:Uncharacterized protein n=1 Tax=Herbidospora solisilvae TaxID=2696284 RepID=A0A7C9JE34_9ACTN|nr:hypothetical protein [Herbidospora solisilvae]NAS24261.1 hypothetical protein [Herbidospora solisilvae]